jgi:hypothetical protein
VVDGTGRKISLPRGSSDAALAPYHVERSKLFVLDRIAAVEELDSARIARAIGFTRFPYEREDEQGIDELGSLLRAADLIGQLGDPHYLRKANALYYEFEEIGLNRQLGYESPADIVDKYPQFYWNNISPHIRAAIGYLNVTSSGRWWIAPTCNARTFSGKLEMGWAALSRNRGRKGGPVRRASPAPSSALH